jgi:hypothetical protein
MPIPPTGDFPAGLITGMFPHFPFDAGEAAGLFTGFISGFITGYLFS